MVLDKDGEKGYYMCVRQRNAANLIDRRTAVAQKDTNPYIYSDSNKRYMIYDWYLKQRFGGKIA